MKWRDTRNRVALGLACACLLFSGCGSKSKTNVVTVTVTGGTLLFPAQTETITALVQGATDTSVTWDCSFTTTTTTTSSTGTTTSTTSKPAACSTATNGAVGDISNPQDTTVIYTAPSTFPDQTKFPSVTVIITATSKADKSKSGKLNITLDSGIHVTVTPFTATVGTNETFQFTAGTTNDATPNDVTWFVTQDKPPITTTSKHCDPTCGSVDSTGKYTAPATLPTTCTTSTTSTTPTPCLVTLVAISKVDSSRASAATVTIVTAATITFTGISPTVALQGGILQDILLNAANLRSTVSVLYQGPSDPQPTQVDPSQLNIANASIARLRLNASNLKMAGPAQISVQIQDPNNLGQTITLGPLSLQIVAVRPGLINSLPDSFTSGSGSLPGPITIDGGFFGPNGQLATVQFNGNNQAADPKTSTPRQLNVTLSTVPSGGTGAAGLYPISVINSSSPPSIAVSNVAVQPDFAGTNTACIVNTVNLPVPAGSTATSTVPSAIAIDHILEYAAVTEEATNTVQFVNIASVAPNGVCPPPVNSIAPSGSQFPVGNLPTSVAIDEFLSPSPGNHLAVVVNNGDKSLTLLQIPSGAVVATVDLSTLIPPATTSSSSTPTSPSPYAVGIDPFTHRALVAFASTNAGFVVNLDPAQTPACLSGTAPYCPVASIGTNTGAHPQIVFDPDLRVSYVTPGGAGAMSVVDLNNLSASALPPSCPNPLPSPPPTPPAGTACIAASPDGAKRTLNSVTIKTATPHGIDPARGGTVFISGVTSAATSSPTNFNGSFRATSVIDAFTFTYAQTASNDTGGGGSMSVVPNPFITFAVSSNNQGIALNSQTHVIALADPNTQFGQITFVKTPDETVSSVTLTVGSFLTTSGTTQEVGFAQVAFQPFSNVLVAFNPLRNEVSVIDPVRPQRLAPAIPTGQTGVSPSSGTCTQPLTFCGAIAVDPATNLALVVNSFSGNVSVVQLGQLKPVHIGQWLLQPTASASQLLAPQTAFTSTADLPISIYGSGFTGSPQVRLDGVAVGPATVVSDRQIDVTIPASLFLASPRRFALDVVNNGVLSNATDFAVAESVNLNGTGCTALQPTGVAIGENVVIGGQPLDLAIVSLNGCNNAAVIDLTPGLTTFGKLTQTIAVGNAPTGVAVIPRLGLAVVANSTASGTSSGAGTASVIDLTQNLVTQSVGVGTEPSAVAINPYTAQAYVLNTKSNTMTQIDLTDLTKNPLPTTIGAVDEQPIAMAIDPDRQIAVVGAVSIGSGGVLDVVNISGTAPVRKGSNSASANLPTGVVFDPVSTDFLAVDSLGNDCIIFNPDTGQSQTVRVGVNPTSLAYDYQTGTLITVNTISNTVSFVDAQRLVTKATLPLGLPQTGVGNTNPQFGVAVHMRSNLAVIADQINNRVLLYPMPH